ncbi:MAG: sulfite exporter TauE/SafE family protein [Magnetococcales bacterium]|nr:sulfite exporter TauE/SafE family protein [Magnetococcales bacterium]
MENVSLLVPLLLAFSSVLHCLGMCGGIVGAMSWHLASSGRPWGFLLAANAGRVASYALAGGLVVLFGQTLFTTLSPEYGHTLLRGFAGVILVGNGLFLLGRLPGLRHMEAVGSRLWAWLEPVARRFMTPGTMGQALLFGVVWGWFPCSLVYGALLWSSTACSALSGAAVMLLFGLGTLPVMVSAGWLTGYLGRFRRIGAWLLLGIGILNLIFLGWNVHNPHWHPTDNRVNCLIPP